MLNGNRQTSHQWRSTPAFRMGALAVGVLIVLASIHLSADRRQSGGSARQSNNASRSAGANRDNNYNRPTNTNANRNTNVNTNTNANRNTNVNTNTNVNPTSTSTATSTSIGTSTPAMAHPAVPWRLAKRVQWPSGAGAPLPWEMRVTPASGATAPWLVGNATNRMKGGESPPA